MIARLKQRYQRYQYVIVGGDFHSEGGAWKSIYQFYKYREACDDSCLLVNLRRGDGLKQLLLAFLFSPRIIVNGMSALISIPVLLLLFFRKDVALYPHDTEVALHTAERQKPVAFSLLSRHFGSHPVFCVSSRMAELYQSRFESPHTLVVYEVTNTDPQPDFAEGKTHIVMVGSVNSRKGYPLFRHVADLLEDVATAGHDVHWIITGHEGAPLPNWTTDHPVNFDVLPASAPSDIDGRFAQFLQRVEVFEPDVYISNFDFDMLWAAPAFPKNTRTAFICHSDDPSYYRALEQSRANMDSIICVSSFLKRNVTQRFSETESRSHFIPFGVPLPPEGIRSPGPFSADQPLEVIYCGRLSIEQKRIFDLADIITQASEQELPVRFHIAGAGPDETPFLERIQPALDAGLAVFHGFISNSRVREMLGKAHVFILTSDYEGLPVGLLEAMAAGAIPLVTDIKSGIPDVVTQSKNGLITPIGNPGKMVESLAALATSPETVQELSSAARSTIIEKYFTRESAAENFLQHLQSLGEKQDREAPDGSAKRPPHYRLSHRLL